MRHVLDRLGTHAVRIWGSVVAVLGVLSRRFGRATLTSERGDVPGWVLITLMTAGIVVLLMAVAGPTLRQIFVDAMNSVTG